MKFKVTATIPIELEIDCQSKKEALDTATTILQEQRYDDDYASIVADCIEFLFRTWMRFWDTKSTKMMT